MNVIALFKYNICYHDDFCICVYGTSLYSYLNLVVKLLVMNFYLRCEFFLPMFLSWMSVYYKCKNILVNSTLLYI